MKFTVYAEKDIFENIVVFNDQAPYWYSIFCNHSEVCLNLTDEELASEEVQGTPIFEFIMANGGRSPIALKDFFEEIYEDNKVIAEKPRSAFFLNYSKAKADTIQSAYGVIVQSNEFLCDEIIKGTAHYELPKNTILQSESTAGWNNLFDFSLPPSNSIVITDDWLFKNEEKGNIVGEVNVVSLLDAILPKDLSVEYHVLIITDDQSRTEQRCLQLAANLKKEITALRKYSIIVEIVFMETKHKRKAILNYISITCDKGFAMFRTTDLCTVRDENDFRYEKIFNRIHSNEGHTVLQSDSLFLEDIKKRFLSVKKYINNRHQDSNRRILGDCNADKSLKNRLINDV